MADLLIHHSTYRITLTLIFASFHNSYMTRVVFHSIRKVGPKYSLPGGTFSGDPVRKNLVRWFFWAKIM
jgi:hypothetical protein